MLHEKSFDTGTVTINYVEGPRSGAPLLLIHGLSVRWQIYLPIMPPLLMRWHVYALDNRGCGKSGRVPGRYRFADYPQDTIAFLKGNVSEPAVLCGHSLGAMASIAVAAQAPELVRAVILEDPPLGAVSGREANPAFQTRFKALREIARKHGSVDDMAREMKRVMPDDDAAAIRFRAKALSQLDPDVFTPAIEGGMGEGYDLDGFLRRISCPVLLLQGNVARGGALADADATRAASLLANCIHVRMPQCGHGIHISHPLETLGIVSNFLESL
jgi:pimeloyl-ACP methyl ester carboxylesterase